MGSASSSAIVSVAARAAAASARTMARKDGSPRGLEFGIWIIEYFINRGGKNLSPRRRAELERAKRIPTTVGRCLVRQLAAVSSGLPTSSITLNHRLSRAARSRRIENGRYANHETALMRSLGLSCRMDGPRQGPFVGTARNVYSAIAWLISDWPSSDQKRCNYDGGPRRNYDGGPRRFLTCAASS
jgi:Protein of unknown function (DUF3175)